ncbi:threonylcarbamoyl-AMP synthase [Telmatocola sphagniphila]|uniref:Threonylcarbamoyl-AMP synthase n=2 Tax=Telmatocola sphagniphila TaxID=1123043 RepID=A0A8E6F0I5_9BACT|nr:threonylcarbamoyl-AMP synthase [Telmatocola sphagniphila]
MGKLLSIQPAYPEQEIIALAASLLKRALLVAFPTETVYGLGANALDPQAVQRIYTAKGRPSTNPLILHINSTAQAKLLASDWPEEADLLAKKFWPGPLTIVLPKSPIVPDLATGGGSTVAIRMPNHPVARALIEASGVPLAAPSANRSLGVSPTRAEHVLQSLGDRVELILDGGPTQRGIESTVVDLTEKPVRILRFGPVTPEDLRNCLKQEVVWGANVADGQIPQPAPGMSARHYSPKTPLSVFESSEEWLRHVTIARPASRRITLFISWPKEQLAPYSEIQCMPSDPAAYAEILYQTLHELDQNQFEEILIELPPKEEEWLAVRDRLTRAAAK